VTGDEPHYLMVAQSLAADGDLDVANNYARNDGARFGGSGTRPELHARVSRTGRTLPVHDLGLPVLLLPAYVAATSAARVPSDALLQRFRMNRGLFAYSLISLLVICVSTAAAGVTIGALRASGASSVHANVIVAVAWLSPPILSNAFLVFPEPFALLVTACTVALWTRQDRAWTWRESATVAMLGALPWLHRKFALYALALLLVLLWRRSTAVRALPLGRKVSIACAFLVLPALLAAWTLVEWGNLAGPLAIDRLPFSWSAFSHGIAGTVLDRENGLVWWAPAYALLPAAWWMRRSWLWPWLIPIAALVIPSAAHDQWWGGFSPAGRFLVPLVPVFCLAAVPLAEHRLLRAAAVALLVPQLLMAAYAWQHPRMLWPQGDGENRVLAVLMPPLSAAYRAIPSFRTAPADAWAPAAALFAGLVVVNAALAIAAGRDRRARIEV